MPLVPAPSRRNRNFAETHGMLIEKAVEIIAESGVEALSVAALARATAMNRSTVYYHFESREALVAEVKGWAAERLAQGFAGRPLRECALGEVVGFVLAHPAVMALWLSDYLAPGRITSHFPPWEDLVASAARDLAVRFPGQPCDAEAFCAILLTACCVGPRVFQLSIRPDEAPSRIAERFVVELQRLLGVAPPA